MRTAVRDLLWTICHLVLVRKFLGQVCPGWIVPLDEPNFLFSPPAFDFFLARNGRANVAEEFEMHEAEDFIPRCESKGEPLAMFDHSGNSGKGTCEEIGAVDGVTLYRLRA